MNNENNTLDFTNKNINPEIDILLISQLVQNAILSIAHICTLPCVDKLWNVLSTLTLKSIKNSLKTNKQDD